MHESLDFTPWLAGNLDRLSQAIGIPLELVDTEVAVEGFAADILARNPQDDCRVLIENQLAASDHAHLGQILTYLAGLDARTVIWVAPSFREPHLSAIRWLNENTTEAFAFFAVRVRVVRIGTSRLLAPLFEVLERPNDWDRQLQQAARDSGELSELGTFRRAFWAHVLARHPDEVSFGPVSPNSNRTRPVPGTDLTVVQYLAQRSVGVYVRGPRSQTPSQTAEAIRPFEAALAARLGVPVGRTTNGYFFEEKLPTDSRDQSNWDRMADWPGRRRRAIHPAGRRSHWGGAPMARPPKRPKQVATLTHDETRLNIPTAEMATLAERVEEVRGPAAPMELPRTRPLAAGERRERDGDLDPQIIWNGVSIRLTKDQVAQLSATGKVEIGDAQLVWRGKDTQDWSDLVVNAPPLYIQEKIHPKVIIDDLKRRSRETALAAESLDLFADFNGLTDPEARTEFYQHDQHWSNRMILGDSLQVMASLAQRESLKGQVQCIYFDPPYGIKFNSNWQVSTLSRDVRDGKPADISREPEQVKAFRDTWKDGIHSYLTYLRDRLTVARELLARSGSVFMQIGDENVHRVRAAMDEVFGEENFVSVIVLTKAASQSADLIPNVNDFILWYSKDKQAIKFRRLFTNRKPIERPEERYICIEADDGRIHDLSFNQKSGIEPLPVGRFVRMITATSQTGSETSRFAYPFWNRPFRPPGARGWSTNFKGLRRAERADRLWAAGTTLMWKNYHRL